MLHLANGVKEWALNPKISQFYVGWSPVTGNVSTGHLSNGPGLASGIGRCRIQDEDTITI